MIAWEADLQKAIARGAAEHKPIMLEFYHPECISCQQMDAVTLADRRVENFIYDKMVAVRVPVESKAQASEFKIFMTPTLVVLDYYGREHQRTLGFIPPDEMVPTLLLGIGKAGFANDQFNEAVLQFNTLLNGYPGSACAPEAMFLRGVARFSSSHTPSVLKETCQQLRQRYPESEWSGRAEPFNLL